MKIEKLKIKNFVLIISTIFIFFVLAVSPPRLALVEAGESLAMTGSIDVSIENKAKVCKDVSCTNPTPGIIDFNNSDDSPLIIDTKKGISGKVWGNELGWIIFNPPYGGVFFDNSATGLLKGTAWSETSGAVNFSVTGQKVIINPVTGEWNGWAWASGPYGGWIKFDCKAASCVRTIWKEKTEALLPSIPSTNIQSPQESSPTPVVEENVSLTPSNTFIDIKEIASSVLNNFSSSFVNLFKGTKETINEKSEIIGDTFNIFIASSTDLLNKSAQITSTVYNYIFSTLINLRNSFLEKLIKAFEFKF